MFITQEAPVGYTIDTDLKEKALKELATNQRRRSPSPHVSDARIRAGAEHLLMQTLHMIVRQIQGHRPAVVPVSEPSKLTDLLSRDDLSPRMRETIEKSRQSVTDSSGERQKLLDEAFRGGLIRLLTMDDGVSRMTAEEIVDHLLSQKP